MQSANEIKKGRGAFMALLAWVFSALLYPFLLEVVNQALQKIPIQILGYPVMEYLVPFGFFFAILSIPWVPGAIKAELLYRKKGPRAAKNYVLLVLLFVSVLFGAFMTLVYRF